ncbi:co-chaperone GroES [Bacteroidota bacterium]
MNLTPLHDRVIVKASEPEDVTKGGIIIPDTAKEKPQHGVIVAVGSGRITDEGKVLLLQVKKDDKVLYGKYSGTEINIDGDEHLMMRESDIFAIVSE